LNFGNLLYLQDLTKNFLLRLLVPCHMFLNLCHQASEFFVFTMFSQIQKLLYTCLWNDF
jgi:hypothetical protein